MTQPQFVHFIKSWIYTILMLLFATAPIHASEPCPTLVKSLNYKETKNMSDISKTKPYPYKTPLGGKDTGYLALGISFIIFSLSAIALLVLKLSGVFSLVSWVWVLSPLWMLGALVIIFFIVALFLGLQKRANI